MIFVGAVLLAVFVLEAPWGALVVAVAALVEVAEAVFWIRLSRRRPPQVGGEALIGKDAEVVTPCLPEGQVRLAGELWRARCDAGADAGALVRVRSLDGLTLVVEPRRPS